jgi:hypothetical protein
LVDADGPIRIAERADLHASFLSTTRRKLGGGPAEA